LKANRRLLNLGKRRIGNGGATGVFDVDERLKQPSAKGDSLERLNVVVDFELFRADPERAVPGSDRAKGARTPVDRVLKSADPSVEP
jgi:hypothetical protein